MRARYGHAVLGAVVVTVGFWLAVGGAPPELLAAVLLGVAGLLAWRGTTLGRLWAWTSLLLGLDSLAWPIVTMVRVGRVTAQPDDQQMGLILTAAIAGLVASAFWISFAWGIFRWVQRKEEDEARAQTKEQVPAANISRLRQRSGNCPP